MSLYPRSRCTTAEAAEVVAAGPCDDTGRSLSVRPHGSTVQMLASDAAGHGWLTSAGKSGARKTADHGSRTTPL
jgi:hypothetical protein